MGHRNGIFAVLALAMSSLALAAMVSTDAYSMAAQSEASGYSALTHEVGGAVRGDADVARGAVEQLNRQTRFQRLDQGRHGGFRQLHVFRRARKTARIDDLDENLHGLQLVHLISYHFLRDYSES